MPDVDLTLTAAEAEALLALLEPWAEEADEPGGDETGRAIDAKLRAAMGRAWVERARPWEVA